MWPHHRFVFQETFCDHDQWQTVLYSAHASPPQHRWRSKVAAAWSCLCLWFSSLLKDSGAACRDLTPEFSLINHNTLHCHTQGWKQVPGECVTSCAGVHASLYLHMQYAQMQHAVVAFYSDSMNVQTNAVTSVVAPMQHRHAVSDVLLGRHLIQFGLNSHMISVQSPWKCFWWNIPALFFLLFSLKCTEWIDKSLSRRHDISLRQTSRHHPHTQAFSFVIFTGVTRNLRLMLSTGNKHSDRMTNTYDTIPEPVVTLGWTKSMNYNWIRVECFSVSSQMILTQLLTTQLQCGWNFYHESNCMTLL